MYPTAVSQLGCHSYFGISQVLQPTSLELSSQFENLTRWAPDGSENYSVISLPQTYQSFPTIPPLYLRSDIYDSYMRNCKSYIVTNQISNAVKRVPFTHLHMRSISIYW